MIQIGSRFGQTGQRISDGLGQWRLAGEFTHLRPEPYLQIIKDGLGVFLSQRHALLGRFEPGLFLDLVKLGNTLNGFPRSILRNAEGHKEPSTTDLHHVIASYDGNLRAADDAVERVISALRKRPNWTDTVVLVTSDHGEAFFEHRRMGHNSTVYDEMLQVPFILRLPPGMATANIGLDRLATLADIVPTLLAAASLQPDVPLDGINLLAEYRPTQGADERTFAAKTAHRRPTRCLRSSRWKVIISNSGRGELYDLENDPQEHTNLSFANRPAFLEKGRLLTGRFLSAPLLPKRIRDTDFSETDREMLKALGYVD